MVSPGSSLPGRVFVLNKAFYCGLLCVTKYNRQVLLKQGVYATFLCPAYAYQSCSTDFNGIKRILFYQDLLKPVGCFKVSDAKGWGIMVVPTRNARIPVPVSTGRT